MFGLQIIETKKFQFERTKWIIRKVEAINFPGNITLLSFFGREIQKIVFGSTCFRFLSFIFSWRISSNTTLVFFVQRPCTTSVCLSVHLSYVFLLSFSSPVVCLFFFRLSVHFVCLSFSRLSVHLSSVFLPSFCSLVACFSPVFLFTCRLFLFYLSVRLSFVFIPSFCSLTVCFYSVFYIVCFTFIVF